MINFKANLLNTTKIKVYTGKQDYSDRNVSFVKLDTNSRDDFRMVRELDRNWDNRQSLVNDISYFFKDCFEKNDSDDLSFYALTRQRDRFEHLDPDEVLGLAQVTEDSSTEIFLDYLQADPNNNYFAYEPLYKKIGTAIIDSLKLIYSGKEMLLKPIDDNVVLFYEKLGFKNTAEGLLSKKL